MFLWACCVTCRHIFFFGEACEFPFFPFFQKKITFNWEFKVELWRGTAFYVCVKQNDIIKEQDVVQCCTCHITHRLNCSKTQDFFFLSLYLTVVRCCAPDTSARALCQHAQLHHTSHTHTHLSSTFLQFSLPPQRRHLPSAPAAARDM